MTPAPVYAEFLEQCEELMHIARSLGLYRTTERLHRALDTARSEQYEASIPMPDVTVELQPGPPREQTGG